MRGSDYAELRAWSVERPELFWPALWRYGDVRASRPWRDVLEGGERMPGAAWFIGAELNFAENLLRHRDDRPAIIAWTEDGRRDELSYRELYQEVAKLAAALQREGVGAGDRVAFMCGNRIEHVVADLGAMHAGAVTMSVYNTLSVDQVAYVAGHSEPTVVILETTDHLARWARALSSSTSVRRIVLIDAPVPDGDALARYEGDEMPAEEEFVATIDTRKKPGKVPQLEASEDQLKKYDAPADAKATGNPPSNNATAPLPSSYPPLESR